MRLNYLQLRDPILVSQDITVIEMTNENKMLRDECNNTKISFV